MDSNAFSQSTGTPFYACHLDEERGEIYNSKDERDSSPPTVGFGMTARMEFSFARGTPVIANRRSGNSYPVIPSPPTGGDEESASLKEIRNDKMETPVRDRPLLKLRDGPSWMIRETPRWYARGKPPARSEPVEYENVGTTIKYSMEQMLAIASYSKLE